MIYNPLKLYFFKKNLELEKLDSEGTHLNLKNSLLQMQIWKRSQNDREELFLKILLLIIAIVLLVRLIRQHKQSGQ